MRWPPVAQKHFFRQESGGRHSAHSKPRGADQGAPSIEFDHDRTSKTLSPSAASRANAQTAIVQISSTPEALSMWVISSLVARLSVSSTSGPVFRYAAKARMPHARL